MGLDHGDVQSVADLPALEGRAVYILDFSFSAEILQAIEARAAKLVLLDHAQACGFKLPMQRWPELLSGQFNATPVQA